MTASLADRFEAIVDTCAELLAVDTGTTEITFAALDRRANRVANWLRSLGFAPGERIGLALWNRVEHLELLLGTFKAGMIPVNVNCRYTATEAEALLVDAGVPLVVHEPTSTMTMSDASTGHDWMTLAIGPDYVDAVGAASSKRPRVARSGADHYLLYTGGSTGTPKGVLWRQDDLFAATMPGADRRRPGATRMLPASPLTHGTAQWITLSTLLSAGTVVLGPLHGLDPAALWTRVAEARVSRLVIVGDAFARPLLDALDAEPDRWDLSALVAITSGGARWSAATRYGLLGHLPHVAMVNSFGATESGGQGSQVSFAGRVPTTEVGLLRFDPDDTTVVLDEHFEPIEAGSGTIGKLAQRGPVPLGYFNDPKRTEATFPVIDGVRHAIPGDLATIDANGEIVVLGRDRNVINTGGEKVFAEEVEARLTSHPDVTEAVVVGIADDRWGESIAALVMVRPGVEVPDDALVAHCAATLARFKIPRHIRVVEAIRYLPTGKLDRSWAADTISTSMPRRERSEKP
ncbi:MAG TPA: AMP-binding protein [Acidimicrobiales bacterium]|nr:AMP-binding protein [Acidimicrobiales bacterium]